MQVSLKKASQGLGRRFEGASKQFKRSACVEPLQESGSEENLVVAFQAGEQRFVRSQTVVGDRSRGDCTLPKSRFLTTSIDRNRGMLVQSCAVPERVLDGSNSWDAPRSESNEVIRKRQCQFDASVVIRLL